MDNDSKVKFMFDTNIFDEILYEDIDLDLLINSDAEYYFTIVQRREINNIPYSKQEKKEKLLEIFKEIQMELKSIPFILGFSPLGSGSHLGSGARYKNIQKDHPDNDMNDSVMVATSINNGIIFVTKDKDLQKTIDEEYSDFCWSWEEFKDWLEKQ